MSMIPFADADRNKKNKKRNDNYYRNEERIPDYRRHNKRRHYGEYRWKHKRRSRSKNNHYRGHWKSRGDWDRHYRKHRGRYQHGRYHRSGDGFMMFELCEEGACFSFSISN